MSGLEAALEKMRADGAQPVAVDTFRHYYERLEAGEAGLLREDEIEPVADAPAFEDLDEPSDDEVRTALDEAVVLKLNGGLGTGMGMTKAKSLLEVKDGRTFLDVIVGQVLAMRESTGARVPLVLMNSFATREDSLAALRCHEGIEADVPLDFVQNRVPKIRADDLMPVEWPANPEQEWAPPGHGDLYPALVASGMLDALLDRGYRYAFVSNSDNLGATLDPRILTWLAREDVPFLMEVAVRSEQDRKGGHLARRRGGGLVLREIAQTADEDVPAFQDIDRHRFFNTNTMWVDLRALKVTLSEHGGVLPLPMIVNRKTVDPADKSSPKVIQLESAMAAAIDVFEGAQALKVPKSRFAPVKTTDDLLLVRSDAYALTGEGHLELVPRMPPLVELDPEFFKLIDAFDARFAAGPPSLVGARHLRVEGDVSFGAGVVVKGEAVVKGPRRVGDGEVLDGSS
ncbi:MAG TPA: UTP--glucose-1-phosphate uridylyltransferase [Solirubrobacteraceae bacterium]|nr:UTP--glucose-1-phosphate uridylyltransferase [Solirubrobacteraceae bacterium]